MVIDIFSTLIGVIATALVSVVIVLLTKKERKLGYRIWTQNVIGGLTQKVPALTITFGGKKIDHLSVSRLLLWGVGRETILARDVAPSDAIRLRMIGKGQILAVQQIQENNKVNQFRSTLDEVAGTVTISFDFIDKDNGVVLQLLHTAESSKDFEIRGTVIGGGSPVRRDRLPRKQFLLSAVALALAAGVSSFGVAVGLGFALGPGLFPIVFLTSYFTMLGVIVSRPLLEKYWFSRVPPGLKDFEGEFLPDSEAGVSAQPAEA
jgi:hypothetical protein